MDFSVKIEGLDKLAQAGQQIQKAVVTELNAAAYASAQQVATEAKQSILGGGKTGRIYKRRTVIHQASAPGEAPASDTGNLVNSIHVALETALTSIVSVLANYANPLEFGTRNMAARPFLQPALEKSKGWIVARFQQAMQNALARK